jgi:hypothetical protein
MVQVLKAGKFESGADTRAVMCPKPAGDAAIAINRRAFSLR